MRLEVCPLAFRVLGVTSLVFSFDLSVLLVFSKCFHSPLTGSGTKFYSSNSTTHLYCFLEAVFSFFDILFS